MNILILGCGRVGARLAIRLERGGHNVSVVDELREAFTRLGGDFRGPTYQGSGMDSEILKKAGIKTADVVVATTGGDNRNLMIVQIAKTKYGRERVVARLKDPVRAARYREMGIETICVTTIIEGLLEVWALKGEFPELPGEASVSGDASDLM
ncbi:Trk system potassium uptake protein TrkA [Abditibacteriota bacterium]|nr:Trk system potassium uptake protein TrkA [Abditibacteriota bacterium]